MELCHGCQSYSRSSGGGHLRMRAVAQRHEGEVRPVILDGRVCAALVDTEPLLHFRSPASPSAKCARIVLARLPTGRGGSQRRISEAQTPSSVNSPGDSLSTCGYRVEQREAMRHKTALVVVMSGAGTRPLSITLRCGTRQGSPSLDTIHRRDAM